MGKLKVLLMISIFVLNAISPIKVFAEELPLVSNNAIVMEASTGKVLYEKNSKQRMYPASTTKLWTAYLVIKHNNDLNRKITVETDLSWVEPTSMFLKQGETFTIRELLEVMMLKSANDVAVLLAVETSGSLENFARLMNEEAKKIGCEGTNFVNPNGLPDDNHYSTAYDMALMAKESVKSKELMEIVNTKEVRIPANEFYPHERVYKNSNKFLTGEGQMEYKGGLVDYKYDVVDGLKTGYTSKAGRCLMTTAELNGTRIVTGVFGAKGETVYSDSRMLIDYAFDNYQTRSILSNDDISNELQREVPLAKGKKVQGYIDESFTVVDEKSKPVDKKEDEPEEEYGYRVMMEEVKLPVKKDDKLGVVEIYDSKEEKIKEMDIHAKSDVNPILDLEQISLLTFGFGLMFIIVIRKIRRRKKSNRKDENIYMNSRADGRTNLSAKTSHRNRR